ncbi:MAG: thioredoxin [Minisyncoccia bacterium]
MSKIINVSQNDFVEIVLKSETLVLVDFWAPWCGPCKMMGPVLEQLAEMMGEKAKIVKVNVDKPDNQGLARDYEVFSIPSLKIFKNGQIIHELGGFIPAQLLKKELENFL